MIRLKLNQFIADKFSMKFLPVVLMLLIISSCSSMGPNNQFQQRFPAGAADANCKELLKSFFPNKKYEKNLAKALEERKLITLKEKIIQVHYPKLEWINRLKKSLNNSIRNFNNNRYPAFYLFSEEDVVPMAKKYAKILEKIAHQETPLDKESAKAFDLIQSWQHSFVNYQKELDDLIEERISLQYNLNLLKKLKIDPKDSAKDLKITFKRNGEMISEVISLRAEDGNLDFVMNRIKKELVELDGTLLKDGKIKDRILRQAMLEDMLTIVHRELESKVKNAPNIHEDVVRELEKLTQMFKNSDFDPSTFGVYKITDKIFMREILNLTKLDVAYAKIKGPLLKLTDILKDYFLSKVTGTAKEKTGILRRIYAKISKISPLKASLVGGSTVVAGIGVERYFAFDGNTSDEISEKAPQNSLGPDDMAHEEQLGHTKEVELEKAAENSKVIEAHVEELLQ